MKKLYITLCTSILLFACSGDDTTSIRVDNPSDINAIPSIPEMVFPTNNLTCTNFNLNFEWDPSTSDITTAFTYTIELSSQPTFDEILFSANTTQTSVTFTLEKGIVYFWRVKATDSDGNESPYSEVQSFFTEPEPGFNSIPFVPELVAPALRSTVTGSTTTLQWNASDTDGDPLTYDVYLGETNPPTLLTADLTTTSIDINISPNTKYYWRVVVKDDKQGVTIGQVWNFTSSN